MGALPGCLSLFATTTEGLTGGERDGAAESARDAAASSTLDAEAGVGVGMGDAREDDAYEPCAPDAFCDDFEHDDVRGAWSDLLQPSAGTFAISNAFALSGSRSLRFSLVGASGSDALLKRAFYGTGEEHSSYALSVAWLEPSARPSMAVPFLHAAADERDGTLLVDVVVGPDGLHLVDARYDNATQTTSPARVGPAVDVGLDRAWHRIVLVLNLVPADAAQPRASLRVDGRDVDARLLGGDAAAARGELAIGCRSCPTADFAVHYDDARVRAIR